MLVIFHCAFSISYKIVQYYVYYYRIFIRVAVELAVQAAKKMADRRWGERLWNDFEGNKKMFWKEVKRVRKDEQAREKMVKDVNGQILREGVKVRRR